MRNIRINDRRKELKLTQSQVAKIVGVTKASISQWEKGDTFPKGENLLKLGKALMCEPQWLLTGKRGSITQTPNTTNGPEIKSYHPLISWVNAGEWAAVSELNNFEAERYPCPIACSEDTFVLRVQGISMEPVFKDGDLIFVDPEADHRHLSYVVARLENENEATFKQLIIESGSKYLKPLNKDWPNQITPINSDCNIVGTVIFSGRVFV
jgi:SOS-response transcriptional repressor LexA